MPNTVCVGGFLSVCVCVCVCVDFVLFTIHYFVLFTIHLLYI